MSFLLLDGWRLPAFNETPQQSFAQHGEVGINWMNRPTRTRRALPASWQAQMAVMLAEDADTLEGLLMGQGHHVPCDVDAFSDAGLGPEAGGGYSILTRTPTAGMFGLGYLNITTNVVWNPELPDVWTVGYWRTVTGTPAHVVVRSDGAKFLNGVRADATVTTELTVSNGAVALTVGAYDDLFFLPFKASDGFLGAFYRWTTAKDIQWQVPFNGFDDEQLNRGVTLSTSAVPLFVTGQIAQARRFAGVATAVYTGTKTQAFGASELSFECWFIRRSALVEGAPKATILDRFSGGVAGYGIFVNTTGIFTDRMEAFVWTAAGQARTVTPVSIPITKDVWHHLVVTWTQVAGVVTIYLDNVNTGAVVASFPGSAAAADGGATTSIGNNSVATQVLGGDVDEFRMHRRALTSVEVYDHWQAGRHNLPAPVLQPFSKLPALEIDGGIVGWRQTTVLGDQGEEPLVQHASATGWKNASRTPNAVLDERQQVEPSGGIPAPQVGLVLAERFDTATSIRLAQGGFANATRVVGAYGAGPFGFGRAYLPTPAGRIDLPTTIAAGLGGKRFLTVLAWVRRAATGVQHTVLIHERAAASVKVRLDVTAGNLVRFGGRASAADAAEVTRVSVATFFDTVSFHLVGGIIDLQTNRLATVLDTTVDEGAATFAGTPTTFSVETGVEHHVGVDNGIANRWNGGIATVWWWFRRLSLGEIRAVYNAGRSGSFL